MKRVSVLLLLSVFCLSLNAGEPRYIGAAKCSMMCHKGEKKGKQWELWQGRNHANAFNTLGTPKAKETAVKKGIKTDPQKTDECLRCHVTAFGVKKELIDSTCSYKEGVSCEECHGPGSEYRKLNVMKDHNLSVAAGLIEQNEAVCTKCHNKESPNFISFSYEEGVSKIAHPAPKK